MADDGVVLPIRLAGQQRRPCQMRGFHGGKPVFRLTVPELWFFRSVASARKCCICPGTARVLFGIGTLTQPYRRSDQHLRKSICTPHALLRLALRNLDDGS
jgi:hypothetical protein